MKLFTVVSEDSTPEFINPETEEVLFPSRTIYECEMIPETVDYLLNGEGGATLDRIRYLVANIYNCSTFPFVDLFSLIRNADEEHQELVMDIVGISQSKYGESCFVMINQLAPKIIRRYNLKRME